MHSTATPARRRPVDAVVAASTTKRRPGKRLRSPESDDHGAEAAEPNPPGVTPIEAQAAMATAASPTPASTPGAACAAPAASTTEARRPRLSVEDVRGPVMIGQTDPERRALRSEQRALNDRISACSTELGHLGSDMFDKISSMNNRLFKRVRYTREAVHDADNLKAISQHAVRRAESLGSSVSPYSASKLVRALHSKLLDPHTGSFDWHMLGVAAGVCFNSLPSTEFMLGPIGQTTPEKAAKVGKAPDASRSEADDAPVETIHADLSGARREENTNRRMATLRRLIEDREREDSRGLVDLFRLTSNPSSFTQTVENVFDFSFLIKDGRARLKIDAKTGVPVTQLTKPPEKAHIHNQLVVAFNMRDWRNICNAQQLAAGDVPHRNDPCYAPEAR